MKELFKDWKTIPNLLCVIRILLVPLFVILYVKGYPIMAVSIVVVSGLTDCFDGKIARKFNQVSDLGKLLDPIADKLTQIAVAMVLFCWFYDRKQIHVGTLVYQLVYGFCIDIFEPYLIYSDNRMINFLLMLLGITFLSLGSALYSIADLGRGSYEAMTFALVNRRGWKISYTRISLDIICVVTGFALGGKVGLCTIATILISGPLLQLFVKMCKSVIQI